MSIIRCTPPGFDEDILILALEVQPFLNSLSDHGKPVDWATMANTSFLLVTVTGIDFELKFSRCAPIEHSEPLPKHNIETLPPKKTEAPKTILGKLTGVEDPEFDEEPLVMALEIKPFLESLVDQGTSVYWATTSGLAFLVLTVGGSRYQIQIRQCVR